MARERVALRGSERRVMRSAQVIDTPDPNSLTPVTILLRRRNSDLPEPGSEAFTRDEFASRFGADPADIAPIEPFASDNDLTVVDVNLALRSIVLAGTVANMNESFATELLLFQSPEGVFRGRVGTLYIPSN